MVCYQCEFFKKVTPCTCKIDNSIYIKPEKLIVSPPETDSVKVFIKNCLGPSIIPINEKTINGIKIEIFSFIEKYRGFNPDERDKYDFVQWNEDWKSWVGWDINKPRMTLMIGKIEEIKKMFII